MTSLSKRELERVRQVNEMKLCASEDENLKLMYESGANLVLLRIVGHRWVIIEQTGPWYEDIFEYDELQ